MAENTEPYVMKVTAKGFNLDQECMNVFYYASPTFTDTVQDMLEALDLVIFDHLPHVMGSSSVYLALEGEMVKGANDIGNLVVNHPGIASGEMLPPFVSWDFTYLRAGAGERNGYKRFFGLTEALQQNGGATSAALAELVLVADDLETVISGPTDVWVPVIRRTRVDRVVQIPPKYYDIGGVQYSRIGSQNSRKFGHGR